MKIYFRDQKDRLASFIPKLKSTKISYADTDHFPERQIKTLVLPSSENLEQYDLKFLFGYDIFPTEILEFFGEWQLQNRSMEPGDVIAQQVKIPPGPFSLKLVFGVRVLSVYRDKRRAGFIYGTLKGHPETGTNEFSIFISNHSVSASVHTRAKPGLLISRLLAPFFTKPYVNFCNHRALSRIKEIFLQKNPELNP